MYARIRAMSTLATKGWPPSPKPYPSVARLDTSFTYTSPTKGKVTIPDPYNALETPPSTSTVTRKFVEQQQTVTRSFLDKWEGRERFRKAISGNWNHVKIGTPARRGKGDDEWLYHDYNSGLDSQPSIYRFKQSVEPQLFFSPDLLSKDGTASLTTSSFSNDGSFWAYGISRSGSDWVTLYVRKTSEVHPANAERGSYEEHDPTHLPNDVIEDVKFGTLSWAADSRGFYYQRWMSSDGGSGKEKGLQTERDVNASVWYHRVGTAQDQDEKVFQDEGNPSRMYSLVATEDGKYLVLHITQDASTTNLLWVTKAPPSGASHAGLTWHKLVNEFGELWAYQDNSDSRFVLYTNADGAHNYKLATWDFEKPEAGFRDLIPHDATAVLSNVRVCSRGKHLLLVRSKHVRDSITLHDYGTGALLRPVFPELVGNVDGVTGRKEDDEVWIGTSGFCDPGSSYRYSISANKLESHRSNHVEGLHPSEFVSEQIFYESKDGTRVPMFLTRHRDVKIDGTAPVLQYAYGGYGWPLAPFFEPAMLTWVKHFRGVLAVPGIRGGGEYGHAWHVAGIKENRQNTFDDMQYATKWIHEHGYGARDKVAIHGGSNGGLMVAACLNQAPNLFGAMICDVGVLDLLRFQHWTIGATWVSEYGSVDDGSFDHLIKFSPLHNIDSKSVYPPVIVLTGDHDDRVVPAHSLKYIAELQHQLEHNKNPLLLRVEGQTGHGAGKSTEKEIEEAVDKYGFLAQCWDLPWHD